MIPFTSFPEDSPYRKLANALDSLPNRFPAAEDESDLRLLAKVFTIDEAELASQLSPDLETPSEISQRLGCDQRELMSKLKDMTRKGLIAAGKTPQGRFGFGLMPFVVGIYEDQRWRFDAELAQLFEDYFHKAFGQALKIKPQLHRVIPIGESIKTNLEIQPYESVYVLLGKMKSWGVINCICRVQKSLIGQGCQHPVDNCMIFSDQPDAFSQSASVRVLTQEEAIDILHQAANAGLVHCVSNNQRDLWYICNCCTCSCGILRGMVDLGISNVVARSAFINRIDEKRCIGCGECISACQFNALSLDTTVQINETRCAGCGVCIPHCSQNALYLERRKEEPAPPLDEHDWGNIRKAQ